MRYRVVNLVNFWSKLIIAVGFVTVVGIEYVRPWIADQLYADEYKRLAYACDNAMHDEVALRSLATSTEKHELLIKSADVGLLVCHDYDKLRKKMLNLGVTDEQLAIHGLEVLEIESIPVSRMVEPHRMPRF